MIRVEYEIKGDFRYRMLTDDEVVKAFIKEFSSEDKKAGEVVLDIYKGIDPTVADWELAIVEKAVKALVKRVNYNITDLVQKVLAPAHMLAHGGKEVLKKYCRGLDMEAEKAMRDEFMKKHELTEMDYRNLVRYEDTRKSGGMNMFEYLYLMKSHGINGGAKLATLITEGEFYSEFLETVEGV